jgi:hypothetical protein
MSGQATSGLTIVKMPSVSFRNDVMEALEELAPCFKIRAVKRKGKGNGYYLFADKVKEDFCKLYCANRAGSNLVWNIINAGGKTWVAPLSSGGSKYDADKDVVYWNKSDKYSGESADGRTRRPPLIGLAHELIHTLRDRQHQLTYDTIKAQLAKSRKRRKPKYGELKKEEAETCYIENLIRAELRKRQDAARRPRSKKDRVSQRVTYGGFLLPPADPKVVKEATKDLHRCKC